MIDSVNLLLIDDNTQMRLLLRQLVFLLGIKDIIEATNGLEALTILRERRVDLILTDLKMEPVDGIEFTRQVRQSTETTSPYVPIIMVTGHSERHLVETARDAGVSEFLVKPITTKNLFMRISEIVERPRPFVNCQDYFGPDRRRRRSHAYHGPLRRRDDWEISDSSMSDNRVLVE